MINNVFHSTPLMQCLKSTLMRAHGGVRCMLYFSKVIFVGELSWKWLTGHYLHYPWRAIKQALLPWRTTPGNQNKTKMFFRLANGITFKVSSKNHSNFAQRRQCYLIKDRDEALHHVRQSVPLICGLSPQKKISLVQSVNFCLFYI